MPPLADQPVRHLFIVSRERRWLFDYLVDRFADDPKVLVILDRRFSERRTMQVPITTERRRSDRRTHPVSEEELLQQGCVIVDL